MTISSKVNPFSDKLLSFIAELKGEIFFSSLLLLCSCVSWCMICTSAEAWQSLGPIHFCMLSMETSIYANYYLLNIQKLNALLSFVKRRCSWKTRDASFTLHTSRHSDVDSDDHLHFTWTWDSLAGAFFLRKLKVVSTLMQISWALCRSSNRKRALKWVSEESLFYGWRCLNKIK